jgi:hypothetical protein
LVHHDSTIRILTLTSNLNRLTIFCYPHTSGEENSSDFPYVKHPFRLIRPRPLRFTLVSHSYLVLIVIGHMRDFFGKKFYPAFYAHLTPKDVSRAEKKEVRVRALGGVEFRINTETIFPSLRATPLLIPISIHSTRVVSRNDWTIASLDLQPA